MNAHANHRVSSHAHEKCCGWFVDEIFVQVKLLLYVVICRTWKTARNCASKKWKSHAWLDRRFFYGNLFDRTWHFVLLQFFRSRKQTIDFEQSLNLILPPCSNDLNYDSMFRGANAILRKLTNRSSATLIACFRRSITALIARGENRKAFLGREPSNAIPQRV